MPEIPMPSTSSSGDDGSSSEADDFQDASEITRFHMDLHTALDDCSIAIKKFFNNDIEGALRIMKPWKEQSLYHAHGAAIFEFIPAVLTMDLGQRQKAQAALDHTIELCDRTRRNSGIVQTLGSIIKKPNYSSYTDAQAHAELINAECQLLIACLGVLEGEDMSGLLRASFRIRSSFSCYKSCLKILERKTWEHDQSRWHFASGVKLGLATFNIMIAMLPPKIISLLEFVGFTANKEKGLGDLLEAVDLPGLRTVMCRMSLLAYHLVVGHFASIPPDLAIAEKILRSTLDIYPTSAWFLLFKGRHQLLSGLIKESVLTYHTVASVVNMWCQVRHLAYWESMWANTMMMEWRTAATFAEKLSKESKWSTTIYMYAHASMIIEMNGDANFDETNRAAALFVSAPQYRQRIMGRSIPMEKFVARRCEKCIKRGFLVLPAIELLCLWNMFQPLASDEYYSDKVLKYIEEIYEEIELTFLPNHRPQPGARVYDIEDRALVRFLRGALLSAMGLPRLAMRQLEAVIKVKDQIKDSLYLVPYSVVETAMCHFSLGDFDLAITQLHEARRKYTGYVLDSRLHFRIHAKLNLIRAHQAALAAGLLDKNDITAVTSGQAEAIDQPSSTAITTEPRPGPSREPPRPLAQVI